MRLHTLHCDEGIITIYNWHTLLSRHWYILQKADGTTDEYLVLSKKRRRLTYRIISEENAHWVKAQLITSHLR